MNIFADNTLAPFKNQLPQNISVEGDGRVALSEIFSPSNINNVYTDFFITSTTRSVFGVEEEERVEEKAEEGADEETGEEVDEETEKKAVEMLPNVLPLEASHSSLDIFERSPVLITFESSFEQKISPIYSPNGPSLDFEVVGDRNYFLDSQKFFLEIECKLTQTGGTDLRYDATSAAN